MVFDGCLIMDHPKSRTEVWPDGSSYEGSWFQGALHGQGRFDSRFDGGRYMQGVRFFFGGTECSSVPHTQPQSPDIFRSSLKTEHEYIYDSMRYYE